MKFKCLMSKFVLISIQVYWSSILILPQKVTKGIEVFFLVRDSGSELKVTGANIGWSFVCVPKEEGGLGFRRLRDWNKAAMSNHLWAIAKKADTLCLKWIHEYVIKDHCLWYLKVPIHAYWTVRIFFLASGVLFSP